MGTPQQSPSLLFLVRLWDETGPGAGPGPAEWHGKVLHVVTGEAHYFSGWPALVAILQTMVPPGAATDPQAAGPRRAD